MEKSDWNKYRAEIKEMNGIDISFEPIKINEYVCNIIINIMVS